MAAGRQDFETRVARIERRRLAIAEHGARPKVGEDGLVEYVPKRGRTRVRFPWRVPVLIAVFLFAGKVGLFHALGPEAYAEKLADLQAGDPVRQAGAAVMQVDPATAWIAAQIARIF